MVEENRESNLQRISQRRDGGTIGAIPADRNSGKKAANWPPLDLG